MKGAGNHGTDCYFCVINLTGINRKNRSSLKYPDLQSARRPVADCDEIQITVFGELPDISDEDFTGVEENEQEVILDENAPHPFSQMELNDPVRDLGLSKSSTELFIDSSKQSLKCVLMHNGNRFASVPFAHSTALKEKYEALKYVLEKMHYDQHEWDIYVDLKMVSLLLRQQTGFTK